MNTPLKKPLTKPLTILYEDECYIVFDKPAGLVVIPTPKKETKTLVSLANQQLESDPDFKNSYRLHPCHRLDRDTTGAIIFAKGKRHQQLMMKLFQDFAVEKKYIAIVHGKVEQSKGEIKGHIRGLDKIKYQKRARPQLAITRFKVVKRDYDYSVLEVYPLTGRTNQIRIQFSDMGHPLIGERKYAFARDYSIKFKRTALHAKELQLKHPVTHKKIKINSPLPEDMKGFLNRS